MLKIKDSVDLKELEKYGFKYRAETQERCEGYETDTKNGGNVVFVWNREVFCQDLDILYDLIKADLVEKV